MERHSIMKHKNASTLAQAGIPEATLLCKYRPLDARALSIVKERELYFAPPSSFNDPFDCDTEALVEGNAPELQAIWQQILSEVKAIAKHEWRNQLRCMDAQSEAHEDRVYPYAIQHKAGSKSLSALVSQYSSKISETSPGTAEYGSALKKFYTSLLQIGQTQFGICPLAGDAANILMWSHYAANHTGIALLFDSARRIFEKQPGISHHHVNYHTDRKVNVAKEGWPGSFVQLFTRKAPDWDYEKESRYVAHTGPGPKKFKRAALRGIVLGCCFRSNLRADPQRKLAEELLRLLEVEKTSRVSGPKFHIFVAEKKRGAFALAVKRFNDVRALREYLAH